MMDVYKIPLIPGQNQVLSTTVDIGGVNKRLELRLFYNERSELWWMDVYDAITGSPIVCGTPLLEGEEPCRNLLEQFDYLGIGACELVPASVDLVGKKPELEGLGLKWFLLWGEAD